MRTTAIGQRAESAVADFLIDQGWLILARNWKTPRCEIDIVAKKGKSVYFVEVKYRASQRQGDGLEYITSRKLGQMNFAGRVWNLHNNWDGDFHLVAADVSGLNFEYINILEIA